MHNYQRVQRRENFNVSIYCTVLFITSIPITRLLPTTSRNIPLNSVLRWADVLTHKGGAFVFFGGAGVVRNGNQRDITGNCHSVMYN
jgi:hypothetical protein